MKLQNKKHAMASRHTKIPTRLRWSDWVLRRVAFLICIAFVFIASCDPGNGGDKLEDSGAQDGGESGQTEQDGNDVLPDDGATMPTADVSLAQLIVPAGITAGQEVAIRVTSSNAGPDPSGALTLAVYLSADDTIDAADLLLGTAELGSIVSGGSLAHDLAVRIPANHAAEEAFLVARVEMVGPAVDPDASNNQRSQVTSIDRRVLIQADVTRRIRENTLKLLGQVVWAGFQAYAWDPDGIAQKTRTLAMEFFVPLRMGLAGHFPGGAGVITHDYHWKSAVGSSRIDPTPREQTYDFGNLEFGPDEYGRFLEEYRQATGAQVEGSIQVNVVQATDASGQAAGAPTSAEAAAEAADWVEYMNAPNDGSNPGGGIDWAAERAANGHPAPYLVHFWELGNEPHYTANDIGNLSCEEYAERIALFAAQMKARDPTIEVMAYVNPFFLGDPAKIGTSETFDDQPEGICLNGTTWSQHVIQAAGMHLDYLYFHWYGAWNDAVHTYDFILSSPQLGLVSLLDRLAANVDAFAPDAESRIRLKRWFIPEWNVYGSWWGVQDGRNVVATGTAMLGGVATSRVLHVLFSRPEVAGAMHSALVAPFPYPEFGASLLDVRSGYMLLRTSQNEASVMSTAAYQVWKLWAQAYQPTTVGTNVTNGPVILASGASALDATTLVSSDSKNLSLVVSNAGETAVDCRVDLGGFTPASAASQLFVTAETPAANNTWAAQNAVMLGSSQFPAERVFAITVPAYSVWAVLMTQQ